MKMVMRTGYFFSVPSTRSARRGGNEKKRDAGKVEWMFSDSFWLCGAV